MGIGNPTVRHRTAPFTRSPCHDTVRCSTRAYTYGAEGSGNCARPVGVLEMAPRTTGDRGSWRRQTQKLLEVPKRVLQQADNGLEPLLTASDLVIAARAAREHEQHLQSRPNDLTALWVNSSQDTAAYLALFSLALRRSTPYHAYDGPESSYASLRDSFFVHLDLYQRLLENALWGSVCYHLLGPALLRTDALQCYSRLLAQAADQLRPAAAAVLPAAPPEAAAFRPPAGGSHADAMVVGAGGTSSGRAGQGAQQVILADLQSLLANVLQVVTVFVTGVLFSTRSQCAAGPRPAGHPVSSARAQLQSSWVLEHWAQVVLLGAAAATGSGRSRERLAAQGNQAAVLHALSHALNWASDLPFTDLLRRPCGCALAATHMAQLCAALDGGDAFGAAKPEVLVMRAYDGSEQRLATFAGRSASQHDAALAESGCGVSLHSAVVIVEGWATLLAERLADGPHAVAGVAAAGGAATEEAHAGGGAGAGGAGHGGGSASESRGGTSTPEVGQGTVEGYTAAAGATLCKLPPFNRTATFHLCLRLAKGVLACWGEPLPGVMLNTCVRGPNRVTPALPKMSGAVLLHQALACARLALLPAVWGRERVPRRTRAQLRAWWETYVAAARHPEALVIALPQVLDYPDWTHRRPKGLPMRPSADAAAAIEAGVIPCVTWWVTCMGAAGNKGALWSPPDAFAGVKPCWRDVYQLGPLEQTGELVSAVGRRLPLAVEELRAFAVAIESGKEWRRSGSGRTVGLLSGVLREVMSLARSCLRNLHLAPLYSADTVEVAAGATGSGGLAGSAAAAAQFKHLALRSSFALAELLPPLSVGVQLCAGLLPLTRRVERQAQEAAEQGGAGADVVMLGKALRNVIDCSYECASVALECCVTVMAWHCGVPTGDRELGGGAGSSSGGEGGSRGDGDGSGDGESSGGGSVGSSSEAGGGGKRGGGSGGGSDGGGGGPGYGSGSSADGGGGSSSGCGGIGDCSGSSGGSHRSGGGGSGGSSSNGGDDGAHGVGPDPAWRRLLLQDVRLVELLGAGLALQREEEAQAVQMGEVPTSSLLREPLARALPLAAASFLEELRAAVDGGPGEGAEAAACGRVAGAAGGAADSVLSRPCISLPAVRALVGDKGPYAAEYSAELELVAWVLGDAGMAAGARRVLSDRARAFRAAYGKHPGVAMYMGVLVPPGEVRGAIAAAAARAPASG